MKLAFAYDSQHRRIRKQVWQAQPTAPHAWILTQDRKFHYQGWNLIAEEDPDKTFVRTYLWGLDLSGTITGAGGTGGLLAVTIARGPANVAGTHLVTTDGQGNVTGLINATTGQPSGAYTYDPFGQLLSATGPAAAANPIRFSTRYEDPETSLLYYGYRFLHPATGRWLNRDPLGEAGGVNLYGYVGNQPNGRIDLYGLSFWDDAKSFFDETGERLQRGWDGAASGAKNVGEAFLNVSQGLHETGAWWGDFIGDAIFDPVAWEKQKAALAGGAGIIAGFWGDYATDSEMRKQVNEALGNSAATTIHGILTDPDKASKFFAAIGANAAFAIAGARGETVLLNAAGEVVMTLKMSLDQFKALQRIAQAVPERAAPLCRPIRPSTFTKDSAIKTDLGTIKMELPTAKGGVGLADDAIESALTGMKGGGGHAIRHFEDAHLIPNTGSLASRVAAFNEIAAPILKDPIHSAPWRIGATQAQAFLGEVNGQYVAIVVAKSTGKVISAIVPDANQLALILSR